MDRSKPPPKIQCPSHFDPESEADALAAISSCGMWIRHAELAHLRANRDDARRKGVAEGRRLERADAVALLEKHAAQIRANGEERAANLMDMSIGEIQADWHVGAAARKEEA